MNATEIERSFVDCLDDFVDGVISDDSSFYGDEEHKTQLNERSDGFDAAEAWNSRGSTLADKASANLAKQRVSDMAKLYNPLQGQLCGRQLEESLDEFLDRLPPRTSVVSAELPWIRVANPYASRRDHSECEDNAVFGSPERFQEVCQAFLEDLEDQMVKLKTDMEGEPAHMLTKAANKKRSETADKIHRHAIAMDVKAGKWMLFIPSVNVDRIWKIIAGATISGDLGISAKVAPHDQDEDPEDRRTRLICIYTKDFSDIEDVVRVLGKLKRLGMVETRGKIYYKPDAYTFLDIKAGNPYGIRPWIYNSSDAIILGKERAEGNALDERTEYGEDNK